MYYVLSTLKQQQQQQQQQQQKQQQQQEQEDCMNNEMAYCYDWLKYRGNILESAYNAQKVGRRVGRLLAERSKTTRSTIHLHCIGISGIFKYHVFYVYFLFLFLDYSMYMSV